MCLPSVDVYGYTNQFPSVKLIAALKYLHCKERHSMTSHKQVSVCSRCWC